MPISILSLGEQKLLVSAPLLLSQEQRLWISPSQTPEGVAGRWWQLGQDSILGGDWMEEMGV